MLLTQVGDNRARRVRLDTAGIAHHKENADGNQTELHKAFPGVLILTEIHDHEDRNDDKKGQDMDSRREPEKICEMKDARASGNNVPARMREEL